MKSSRKKKYFQTFIVRIVALVIAGLMVLGVLVSALVSVYAVEETEDNTEENTQPEMKLYGDGDYLLRIGVLYSDDAADSHKVHSSHAQLGFHLFSTKGTELSYIWSVTDHTVLSFCVDGNLKKSVSGDVISYSASSSGDIGGYHLLLDGSYTTVAEVTEAISAMSEKSPETLLFPCYENSTYVIKCGSFTTLEVASENAETYSTLFGVTCTAVGFSETGIKVLGNSDGKILFGFDNGSDYGIGAYPIKDGETENYLELDPDRSTRVYRAGVYEFKHSLNQSYDGLTVIMITEMDEYITGVIPWEIIPSWPIEISKAMAITARSYAYGHTAKHSSKEGFDLCTTSCCQNHKGHGRVNQRIKDAVELTSGMVLVSGNELVTAYYHSLSGGSIAAGHQVWNQSELAYLQGCYTPWEVLDGRTYGSWTYTADPKTMCTQLNNLGYTVLKDSIADIDITKCDNSDYVYSVLITDIHGNQQRITRARNVKNAFSKYLHTANFTVTHNGTSSDVTDTETVSGIYVMTSDGLKVIEGEENLNIQTALGIVTSNKPQTLNVQTANSMVTCDVLAETKAFINKAVAATAAEAAPTEFTFTGSGNGHGVGLSQYGAKDLCDLGKKYDEILYTYFPSTQVVLYEDFVK